MNVSYVQDSSILSRFVTDKQCVCGDVGTWLW